MQKYTKYGGGYWLHLGVTLGGLPPSPGRQGVPATVAIDEIGPPSPPEDFPYQNEAFGLGSRSIEVPKPDSGKQHWKKTHTQTNRETYLYIYIYIY